jgi:hypothetical protein
MYTNELTGYLIVILNSRLNFLVSMMDQNNVFKFLTDFQEPVPHSPSAIFCLLLIP